jgi:hypothetical protein
MRTASFELVETRAGTGVATLRFSIGDPAVHFTIDGCTLTEDGGEPDKDRFRFIFRCPSSLSGHEVRADGLGPIVTEAVVRASLADGSVRSGVLRADAPVLVLPAAGASPIAVDYFRLGMLHIATGFDHLLFLLALALQLWSVRAVLAAETAFTLSHTLSFSATALGWVRVSPVAAEACIALSLVLLARELCLGKAAPKPTAARGAVVALLFGLVHGLGFAGGLREIGLPDHDAAVALLGFGLGVEVGQIAFLALVLLAIHQRAMVKQKTWIGHLGGLAIGLVGAFWFCQRVALLL